MKCLLSALFFIFICSLCTAAQEKTPSITGLTLGERICIKMLKFIKSVKVSWNNENSRECEFLIEVKVNPEEDKLKALNLSPLYEFKLRHTPKKLDGISFKPNGNIFNYQIAQAMLKQNLWVNFLEYPNLFAITLKGFSVLKEIVDNGEAKGDVENKPHMLTTPIVIPNARLLKVGILESTNVGFSDTIDNLANTTEKILMQLPPFEGKAKKDNKKPNEKCKGRKKKQYLNKLADRIGQNLRSNPDNICTKGAFFSHAIAFDESLPIKRIYEHCAERVKSISMKISFPLDQADASQSSSSFSIPISMDLFAENILLFPENIENGNSLFFQNARILEISIANALAQNIGKIEDKKNAASKPSNVIPSGLEIHFFGENRNDSRYKSKLELSSKVKLFGKNVSSFHKLVVKEIKRQLKSYKMLEEKNKKIERKKQENNKKQRESPAPKSNIDSDLTSLSS